VKNGYLKFVSVFQKTMLGIVIQQINNHYFSEHSTLWQVQDGTSFQEQPWEKWAASENNNLWLLNMRDHLANIRMFQFYFV
jgi:hypothetical protein